MTSQLDTSRASCFCGNSEHFAAVDEKTIRCDDCDRTLEWIGFGWSQAIDLKADLGYSDEKLAELEELNAATEHLWCQCEGDEGFENPTHHADGECADCDKHHWHCGTCGKISQIG